MAAWRRQPLGGGRLLAPVAHGFWRQRLLREGSWLKFDVLVAFVHDVGASPKLDKVLMLGLSLRKPFERC